MEAVAYFSKKTKLKKQNPPCYSVETNIANGIEDPIEKAIEKDLTFSGYNLLVTSETNMKYTEICEIYHNLCRIEESFKIMKSDLNARPVYLRKEDTTKWHFGYAT